jgi:hypothetical protein
MKMVNRLSTTRYGAIVRSTACRYGQLKGKTVSRRLLLIALCLIVGALVVNCGRPAPVPGPTPPPPTPATITPLSFEASVFITPASMEVTSGQKFTVSVEVEPAHKGISAGEINLAFEPEAMQVVNIEPGTLLGERPLPGVKVVDNEAGTLSCSLARIGQTEAPTEPATFAIITLQSVEAVKTGNYELELTGVALADENFEAVKTIEFKGANIRTRP